MNVWLLDAESIASALKSIGLSSVPNGETSKKQKGIHSFFDRRSAQKDRAWKSRQASCLRLCVRNFRGYFFLIVKDRWLGPRVYPSLSPSPIKHMQAKRALESKNVK